MSEELAAFRDRMPGCSVVAFADLSTGMVLASSTARKTTQERLDALCAAARDALTGVRAEHAGGLFAGDAIKLPQVAVQAEGALISCYVHAPLPAQEALCCVISAKTPLEHLIKEAHIFLERASAEG